jgi:RimJ/RimL family protein N-acetyltransferase
MTLTPVITTERLRLRPLRPADAAKITKYAGDFEVARMTTRIPHPYTLAHAEGWLATLGDPLARDNAVFGVDAECEGLVGLLGFSTNDEGRPEVGYWYGRPFWGRGYATEALRAALRWAKTDWGKKLVCTGHFVDNPASGNVLVKAGFLYTGEVRKLDCAARGDEVDARRMVWLA